LPENGHREGGMDRKKVWTHFTLFSAEDMQLTERGNLLEKRRGRDRVGDRT